MILVSSEEASKLEELAALEDRALAVAGIEPSEMDDLRAEVSRL